MRKIICILAVFLTSCTTGDPAKSAGQLNSPLVPSTTTFKQSLVKDFDENLAEGWTDDDVQYFEKIADELGMPKDPAALTEADKIKLGYKVWLDFFEETLEGATEKEIRELMDELGYTGDPTLLSKQQKVLFARRVADEIIEFIHIVDVKNWNANHSSP